MFNSFWVHDKSYNITFQMTYKCLNHSRYALKQFCHENMIKTLINPRYSAFDQTAGTIGQLLVHSDIQAGTIGQQQKARYMGVESVDERLFIIVNHLFFNTI